MNTTVLRMMSVFKTKTQLILMFNNKENSVLTPFDNEKLSFKKNKVVDLNMLALLLLRQQRNLINTDRWPRKNNFGGPFACTLLKQ